jgi:hypothetical protein
MKKYFFNIGLLFAAGLTISVFNSCKDNEPTKPEPPVETFFVIKAENIVGAPQGVATVIIEGIPEITADDIVIPTIFVEAPFRNNGFELPLPNNVPAKYMLLVTEDLEEFENVTISDKNASYMTVQGGITALSSNDAFLGIFANYYEFDNTMTTGEGASYLEVWMYADRDVIANAEESLTETQMGITIVVNIIVDFDLKKGWNEAYVISEVTVNQQTWTITITQTYTTTKPADVAFEWIFLTEDMFASVQSKMKTKSFSLIDKNSLIEKMMKK